MLRAMYATMQAFNGSDNGSTDFFQRLQGIRRGCITSLILFSLLIYELAKERITRGKHGVFLGSPELDLFLLLFADDLTPLASTVAGLQNQINVFRAAAKRLRLTVNLEKV